jgi:DNA-binding transcriptional MocR family regulator
MLQPSDVLVLFALLSEDGAWTLRSLAARLGVPHSKVQQAVDRLAESGLYDADRRCVVPHAAEEFLDHALRYLHPVREGPLARGVPTAWAAAPLRDEIIAGDDLPPVWADPGGPVRGPSIEPLDARLPALTREWPEVAQLAARADALRLGDARSRAAARKHLHDRIYARP